MSLSGELNWTLPEDFAAWPPRRPVESNKGTFGHVAIIAGSLGYHGAAVLAARGALRAQPGLVTVEPQESVYLPVAAQLQAAMVRPWRAGRPLPKNSTAILFGPGLAADQLPDALKKELRALWKTFPGPMIVDASALDWLAAGRPDPSADAVRVITPHPGEAGRLLGISAARSAGGPRCGVAAIIAAASAIVMWCSKEITPWLAAPAAAFHQQLRQSASGAGRQRRFARRLSGRLAGPARLPERPAHRHPFRRLAARRRRRCRLKMPQQLDGGRSRVPSGIGPDWQIGGQGRLNAKTRIPAPNAFFIF